MMAPTPPLLPIDSRPSGSPPPYDLDVEDQKPTDPMLNISPSDNFDTEEQKPAEEIPDPNRHRSLIYFIVLGLQFIPVVIAYFYTLGFPPNMCSQPAFAFVCSFAFASCVAKIGEACEVHTAPSQKKWYPVLQLGLTVLYAYTTVLVMEMCRQRN